MGGPEREIAARDTASSPTVVAARSLFERLQRGDCQKPRRTPGRPVASPGLNERLRPPSYLLDAVATSSTGTRTATIRARHQPAVLHDRPPLSELRNWRRRAGGRGRRLSPSRCRTGMALVHHHRVYAVPRCCARASVARHHRCRRAGGVSPVVDRRGAAMAFLDVFWLKSYGVC